MFGIDPQDLFKLRDRFGRTIRAREQYAVIRQGGDQLRLQPQRRLILTFGFGWLTTLIENQCEQGMGIRVPGIGSDTLPRRSFCFTQ